MCKENEKDLMPRLENGELVEIMPSTRSIIRRFLTDEEIEEIQNDPRIDMWDIMSSPDGITDEEKKLLKRYYNIEAFFNKYDGILDEVIQREIARYQEIGDDTHTLKNEFMFDKPKIPGIFIGDCAHKLKDEFMFGELLITDSKKEYARIDELQEPNKPEEHGGDIPDPKLYKENKSSLIRKKVLSKNNNQIISPDKDTLLTKEQIDFINAGLDKSARMTLVGSIITKNNMDKFGPIKPPDDNPNTDFVKYPERMEIFSKLARKLTDIEMHRLESDPIINRVNNCCRHTIDNLKLDEDNICKICGEKVPDIDIIVNKLSKKIELNDDEWDIIKDYIKE